MLWPSISDPDFTLDLGFWFLVAKPTVCLSIYPSSHPFVHSFCFPCIIHYLPSLWQVFLCAPDDSALPGEPGGPWWLLFSQSMQGSARHCEATVRVIFQALPITIGVHCSTTMNGRQFLSGTFRHNSKPTRLEWRGRGGPGGEKEAPVLSRFLFFPPPTKALGVLMKCFLLTVLQSLLPFRVRIGIHSMSSGVFSNS